MGVRIGLIPHPPGPARGQIQQRQHPPGQWRLRRRPQQADLAQQRVQGRAVGDQHGGIAGSCPRHHRRQGPLSVAPPGVQHRQHRPQHPREPHRRQGPQPRRQRRLAQVAQRRYPQHRFGLDDPRQLTHAAKLPPPQPQHQSHHHRQGQQPRPQAQAMKIPDVGQRRRMDDLSQPRHHRLRRWCPDRAFTPIPLDGAGVPHRTPFLPLRLRRGGHGGSGHRLTLATGA